jgi:hypothetical protein
MGRFLFAIIATFMLIGIVANVANPSAITTTTATEDSQETALKTAGFAVVYAQYCSHKWPLRKRDLYVALIQDKIERFGKEAVTQAARDEYLTTVYVEGAEAFCGHWYMP